MVAEICMKARWKLSNLLNLTVEVKTVSERRISYHWVSTIELVMLR
jgi:hypothetical protein